MDTVLFNRISSVLAQSKERRQQEAAHPVAVKWGCGCVGRITYNHPQYPNALDFAQRHNGALYHMPQTCLHHAGRRNSKELS